MCLYPSHMHPSLLQCLRESEARLTSNIVSVLGGGLQDEHTGCSVEGMVMRDEACAGVLAQLPHHVILDAAAWSCDCS